MTRSTETSGAPAPEFKRLSRRDLILPPLAEQVIECVVAAGGRPVVVGGLLRDVCRARLQERPLETSPDVDIEVFGLEPRAIAAALRPLGSAPLVGKSFPLIRLRGVDVSWPHSGARKTGGEAMGGDIPRIRLVDAARRRDFTMNAMAWDPQTEEIRDPFGGSVDLARGILRHVDAVTFREDPLRALRAVQFIARFQLAPAPETVELVAELAPLLPSLPRERLMVELEKFLLMGHAMSEAVAFGVETGVLPALFPEPARQWNPSCWRTIGRALDAGALERTGDSKNDLPFMLAILLHPLVEQEIAPPGVGRAAADEDEGMGTALVDRVLSRLTDEAKLREVTQALLRHVHAPDQIVGRAGADEALRRLALEVPIDALTRMSWAIHQSRRREGADQETAARRLRKRAAALGVLTAPPKPIIQGRDLIVLGVSPGKEMGTLLAELFERQLEGAFSDRRSGLAYAKKLLGA